MPTSMPIHDSARARLRAAQKAEATALREVEAADRVRQRARQTLKKAEATLQAAQLELVRVSGRDRAARLLDLTVAQLPVATKTKPRQSPASSAAPDDNDAAPGAGGP